MTEDNRDRPTFLGLLEKLTADHPVWVNRESGQNLMTQNGLLQQLREAVFAGMENTGGGASFGSKPPLDTAAADLLEEITNQATEALMAVSHMPTPFGHAEQYVRLWAGQTTEEAIFTVTSRQSIDNPDEYLREFQQNNPGARLPGTVETVSSQYTALNLMRRWVARIEDFFNPPAGDRIEAPCPNCGARYVHRRQDGGNVQAAALNFIRDRETGSTLEARCSACTMSWAPSMFERLAVSIGGKTYAQVRDEDEAAALAEHEKRTRIAKNRAKREALDTP